MTLTVTDNIGLRKSVTQSVTVAAANNPPTAVITTPPTCINLACDFSGSLSTDAGGSITGYAWNFGDGSSSSNTATGVTASHGFTGAGTYTVTLTVTDNGGATNFVTLDVTVAAGPVAPVANFTSPSCTVNVACTFTSTSTDANNNINNYEWSFSDGTTLSGASVDKTFASTGGFTATLTVTDSTSLSDSTDPQSVTVSAAVPVASTLSISAVSTTTATPGSNWTTTITFTVRDNLGALVSGVTVEGGFNNGGGTTMNCLTVNGVCSVTSNAVARTGQESSQVQSLTYTISTISGGLTYSLTNNTDGDGTVNMTTGGNTILVNKPV